MKTIVLAIALALAGCSARGGAMDLPPDVTNSDWTPPPAPEVKTLHAACAAARADTNKGERREVYFARFDVEGLEPMTANVTAVACGRNVYGEDAAAAHRDDGCTVVPRDGVTCSTSGAVFPEHVNCRTVPVRLGSGVAVVDCGSHWTIQTPEGLSSEGGTTDDDVFLTIR